MDEKVEKKRGKEKERVAAALATVDCCEWERGVTSSHFFNLVASTITMTTIIAATKAVMLSITMTTIATISPLTAIALNWILDKLFTNKNKDESQRR